MQLAREQFRAEGYAVLPNFLKGVELNMLRQVQLLKSTCRVCCQCQDVQADWSVTGM